MYRAPTSKEQPGWRGPAKLLDLNYDTGGATITWQGRPFLIPFRHIRKHIAWVLSYLALREYTAALDTTSVGLAPGQVWWSNGWERCAWSATPIWMAQKES